ncbi:MAG: hypothetical protein Q8P25_03275 [Candidatus Curtissbacteria bacterium]|nr:hypothetical protein [Candidatus Curtissbacteria bacterium]MDZ4209634.1 hypothetical protein [Candidatus Curtissbacteria bacterium]
MTENKNKDWHEHKFKESLGDYDLLCNGVKVAFIPLLVAKHQMVKCPKCGEGANFSNPTGQA